MEYPSVSLIVFAYNQEGVISETLESLARIDYPNLEIVVSDDCSPDRTYEIIERFKDSYKGLHKLIVNRNNPNLGLVAHYNKLVYEISTGKYIMCIGGDDRCLPQTVRVAVETIERLGVPSMSFNVNIIDGESCFVRRMYSGDGESVLDIEDYLNGNYCATGVGKIIRRDIYDFFGPLSPDCQTEDSPGVLRQFLFGNVGFSYLPNVEYRVYGANISSLHNLMTRFDPRKIAAQYQRDLDRACDCGLIAGDMYKHVKFRIDRYRRQECAIRRVYKAKYFLLQLVVAAAHLMFPRYSFRDVRELASRAKQWHQKI